MDNLNFDIIHMNCWDVYSLSIKMKFDNSESLQITAIYESPYVNTFLDILFDTSEKLPRNKSLLLLVMLTLII